MEFGMMNFWLSLFQLFNSFIPNFGGEMIHKFNIATGAGGGKQRPADQKNSGGGKKKK